MQKQENVNGFWRMRGKRASLLAPIRWGLVALMVLGVLSLPVAAQEPFDPLTPAETEQARTLLLGDARVKQTLGNDARYRILNVERREFPKGQALAAGRAANVTLYNYTKDEALVATVRLDGNSGVDALVTTKGHQPSLSPEELGEAQQLALADPQVQSQLRANGFGGNDESLIVTYVFAKAMNKQDACSTHRCVILFFNTQDAVLDVNPVVDLSAQRVQLN